MNLRNILDRMRQTQAIARWQAAAEILDMCRTREIALTHIEAAIGHGLTEYEAIDLAALVNILHKERGE